MKRAYPNVAPDPSMYCPSVRITPLGPAPYRMMLTEPVWMLGGGRLEEGGGVVEGGWSYRR